MRRSRHGCRRRLLVLACIVLWVGPPGKDQPALPLRTDAYPSYLLSCPSCPSAIPPAQAASLEQLTPGTKRLIFSSKGLGPMPLPICSAFIASAAWASVIFSPIPLYCPWSWPRSNYPSHRLIGTSRVGDSLESAIIAACSFSSI